jgi:RNA polymerase sigma-70 factor, ECF subfamily
MGNPRTNDEFIRRFVRCQQDLYGFILSLIPNTADAQDVLQETAVALWAKADEYSPDEAFKPWAMQFAWQQIRKFRLYQARRHKHVIALSDEAVAALRADREEFDGAASVRSEKLPECMAKLIDDDRSLLRDRYDLKIPMREAALKRGVEPGQLYKRLGRIRQTLLDCINRTIAADDRRATPPKRVE